MAKKEILSSTFKENNTGLTEEELNERVAQCELVIRALTEEKKTDTQLLSAQEIVKDINGGYNDAIKYERAKIEFLLDKIDDARIAKGQQPFIMNEK